jgi:outer membrane immunogenic protein
LNPWIFVAIFREKYKYIKYLNFALKCCSWVTVFPVEIGYVAPTGIRSPRRNLRRFTIKRSEQELERISMKKILLSATALVAIGIAAPASAADLGRPYTKAAPMMAAMYDWSGFYIGANGGWGSSHKCWDLVNDGFAPFAEGCHDATGGVVGGQIGYRWQSSAWVFGLEAQGDWADLHGSNVSLFAPDLVNRSRIGAFGLFTGQVGYAWNNALLYVKGGAAVTGDRFDTTTTLGNVLVATGADQTRWGGTIGVGLEYGFAPNWSAAIEYDHLFMQDKSARFIDTAGVFFGTDSIRQDVDLVTVRVNYRFGGPVIARY